MGATTRAQGKSIFAGSHLIAVREGLRTLRRPSFQQRLEKDREGGKVRLAKKSARASIKKKKKKKKEKGKKNDPGKRGSGCQVTQRGEPRPRKANNSQDVMRRSRSREERTGSVPERGELGTREAIAGGGSSNEGKLSPKGDAVHRGPHALRARKRDKSRSPAVRNG